MEQPLSGGIANAGKVVRVGDQVLRPSNPHTQSIHRYLAALRQAGFDGAPEPIGIDDDGRERLTFIEGDVPLPPYPEWAQSDETLASIVALLARLHRASTTFDPMGSTWSAEMADPEGGRVVGHNDVCLENVVFRDGLAVGLLDFDFAAPGRPTYDLAALARLCVPIDDEVNAARLGWHPADRPARLRLVADTYRLDRRARAELVETLDATIEQGGEFVRRRVETGDPAFVTMWEAMGGQQRFDRRCRWWSERRQHFVTALA